MSGQPIAPRVLASLRILLAAAFVLFLLAGVAPLPVRAASHAVTVTMNDGNSTGGDSDIRHTAGGGCALSGTGLCSLRDAVVFAFNLPATDTTTITLPAGTYTLRRPGQNEDFGSDGDLDLHNTTVINGAGAGVTIVQASATGSAAGGIDRVFEVGAINGGTVTISGVTIRYGNAGSGGDGGGIAVRSGSSLTLNGCVISDNLATIAGFSGGGGIYNAGTLTMTNSTVSLNTETNGNGGGIHNDHGTVTMTNSTVATNTAHGAFGGGGIFSSGSLTVTNSTIARNDASAPCTTCGPGGGIVIASGSTLTATNTLIAGNTASFTGQNASGNFDTSSKNNLLGTGEGATGITNNTNGNLVGTNTNPIIPLLDAVLRDNNTTNGTQTLALLTGSPAINAGDNATCVNTTGTAPVAGVDQRGISRPQPSSGQCDIGAFEYVFPATTTALTAGPNPSAVGQAVTFTAMVSGGGTLTGSVTFKDGATVIGGGALFSGVATFVTTALSAGSHAITAIYSGDSTAPPSTSASLTQVVGPGGGGGWRWRWRWRRWHDGRVAVLPALRSRPPPRHPPRSAGRRPSRSAPLSQSSPQFTRAVLLRRRLCACRRTGIGR